MPIAAANPTDHVEQLIVLTERLTGLIEQEAGLLAERRPGEITSLSDERDRLAAIYAQEMRRLKEDRTLVAGVPAPLMTTLKAETGRFQAALKGHLARLEGFKLTTEKVVQTVSKEVDARRAGPTSYGSSALVEAARGPSSAIAVNTTV
ncbi:MAG: hypothetical protein AAGF19_00235 [Pseudomonadota bacterium]